MGTHLGHVSGDEKGCSNVPIAVKQEMRALLLRKKVEKEKKKKYKEKLAKMEDVDDEDDDD